MIIDFDTAKERRAIQEIEADEAEWNAFRDQLLTVMMSTSMSNLALATAALNALLEVLQRSDLGLDEAKALVASQLRMFFVKD
jgi:hypothetical protein